MKKRILAILLTFIIAAGIVPLSVPASDDLDLITRAQLAEIIYSDPNLKEIIDSAGVGGAAPEFSDIGPAADGEQDPCTDAQRTAITALAKAGVISGTSPDTFNPTGTVTRAEAVTVLWRAAGCRSNPDAADVSYLDVMPGDWYAPAIHALTAAGIIKGTGGGYFEPNEPATVPMANALVKAYASSDFSGYGTGVTRLDMLVRAYENYKNSPLMEKINPDYVTEFTDISVCTEYEKEAVKFFEQLGVVQGYNPDSTGGVLMLYPYAPASNLQIAMFLKRCAELDAVTLYEDTTLDEQIAAAFNFLADQGADVANAAENPYAPCLDLSLENWNSAVKPDVPAILPESGTYSEPVTVTISSDGVSDIYYTVDGSNPTTESLRYTQPFDVTGGTVVKAVAAKNNLVSEIALGEYSFASAQLTENGVQVNATIDAGEASSAQVLTLTAVYTRDGRLVTAKSSARQGGKMFDVAQSVEIPDGADVSCVKVFAFDGESTLKPICEPVSIMIEQP